MAKALLNIPALSQSLALLWRGKDYLLKEGRLYLWSLSMSTNRDKDYARALRYRRLALAEADKEKANLLNRIADEAERGVLCTAERIYNPASIAISG